MSRGDLEVLEVSRGDLEVIRFFPPPKKSLPRGFLQGFLKNGQSPSESGGSPSCRQSVPRTSDLNLRSPSLRSELEI
jgi:hypothetical protein